MRKILLLANPRVVSAGGQHLDGILRVFTQAGVEVEFLKTGANRAAGEKAKLAIERGIDAVVVCGGDGTVFDVLQGIAGSDVVLGIIPFGTGNVLAQNLDVPRRPAEAARWMLTATPRTLPLGKLTCCVADGTQTWYFAVAAGMGIHAAMMAATHRGEKDRVGRTAYFTSGVKVLLTHPVQPFEITTETVHGERVTRRVSEVIAVRVPKLNVWRTGGDLDRPWLRLASVEGASRFRLARASFEGLLLRGGERGSDAGAARYENVLRVECRPIPEFQYRAPLAVEADGEVLGASCATIEMAGMNVRLLSHAGGAFPN